MKNFAVSAVALAGIALFQPQVACANQLGIAGLYNVFVFGDIVQIGTDVEGRVAAGGDVTYGANGLGNGFSIASRIPPGSGVPEVVAGNNVNLTNGSVGYLEPGNTGSPISQKGAIVYGGSANIAANVGYGTLSQAVPIDFAKEQSYLTGLSASWAALNPTGTTSVLRNPNIYEIDLTGSSSKLNIFTVNANDIVQNIDFKFFAPEQSTVLVNVFGADVKLMDFAFFFNDARGDAHTGAYPYSNILFNFADATNIQIDNLEVDGSVLAPFAHIDFAKDSHIEGNVIAMSLSGQGESHDVPFQGIIPEPATLLLLMVGATGIALRRRTEQRPVCA